MNSPSRLILPIAKQRRIYRPSDVEKKLDKLPTKDHETLRATYERMLEKGPDRFQIKPSGIPVMEHLYDLHIKIPLVQRDFYTEKITVHLTSERSQARSLIEIPYM